MEKIKKSMEKIKERAELNLQYERDFCGYNLSDDMVRRAYVKGATEQKAIDDDAIHAIVEEQVLKAIDKQEAIDIEKACEWIRENADKYYVSSSQADDCFFDSDNMLEDFRKAMEE